jgi:hypothetical protein
VTTIEIFGHGYEDATGDSIGFHIRGTARNEGGTSALVGTPVAENHKDAGAAAWSVAMDADDVGDNLRIRVTGEASHTIDWKGRYRIMTTAGV